MDIPPNNPTRCAGEVQSLGENALGKPGDCATAERYGPTTPVDTTNPRYAQFAELLRTGMDPAEVGRRATAAIRDDELYVFTHPEMRGAVEERFRAILAAFDRAAAAPV